MADLKLDSNHDVSFNDFRLTQDNAESVSQKIKIRLLRYRGEYFKDVTLGIDYFGSVLGKTQKEVVDTIFIDEITDTVGVLTLDAYESILDSTGVYTASFVATTDEGVTFQFNIQPIELL